jgi:hypothetical protein
LLERVREDADCPVGYRCDEVAGTGIDRSRSVFAAASVLRAKPTPTASLSPAQVCARDIGGEKICTELCDPDDGLLPWGNASVCGVFDDELGLPTCAHRFGSCHGSGLACEPLPSATPIAPSASATGSSYTSERWCIDQTVTCDCDGLKVSQDVCQAGNGCPRTPGDLKMNVLRAQ